MNNHIFRSKFGTVDYDYEKLRGCCGAAVVFSVDFRFKRGQKEDLFKAFNKHILTYKANFNLARPKVIMSDKVGGDIYDFCTFNNWLEGTRTYNIKSGNHVILFEMDRDPASVRKV